MLSSAAVLDIKVHTTALRSYCKEVRGDQRAASHFLSAIRKECEEGRMAWQVYCKVKREAFKAGLINR